MEQDPPGTPNTPDTPQPQSYDGPERRQSVADRRHVRRGGRRATDALARIADFVYKLLSEPPR